MPVPPVVPLDLVDRVPVLPVVPLDHEDMEIDLDLEDMVPVHLVEFLEGREFDLDLVGMEIVHLEVLPDLGDKVVALRPCLVVGLVVQGLGTVVDPLAELPWVEHQVLGV